MSAQDNLPLSAHLDFQAESVDGLAEAVQARLAATVVNIGTDPLPINARGNRFDLPSGVLWSCSYGVPLRLRFAETGDFRIQFHRRGLGATQTGTKTITVTERQSCISIGEVEVDFGKDFAQVAWRVSAGVLERKLSSLTGCVLPRHLEFDPVLNLSTPEARPILQLLESLLGITEAGNIASTRLIQTELENALHVALLCSARHNLRDWLDRDCLRPAPWQVRRAETFIEENWDKPITLEDIVAASGASARSVFRGFKEYRGYTPVQFARYIRLQHAKRLLQDPETRLSVTQIAMACGFADVSRFSKDFSRAFGSPPSTFRKGRPLS